MARSKIAAQYAEPNASGLIELVQDEAFDEYTGQVEDAFDEDTDFDVEDDIAFLGEEYDILELDDVLELCNMSKRSPFRN